jgi:hypothetical protein
MLNKFRKIIKRPLLQLLEWTEKTNIPPPIKATQEAFKKDIRIPVPAIAGIIYISVLLMISYELELSAMSILGFVVFVAIIMWLSVKYINYFEPEFLADDESVMLTGLVLVFVIFLSGALKTYNVPDWGIPVSSAVMLLTLLISIRIALLVGLVLSVFLGVLFDFSMDAFFIASFTSIVATFSASKVKNRHDLIKVGYNILLVLIVLTLVFNLMHGSQFAGFWKSLKWGVANSFVSVMITFAALPYLERFFSKTTSIRLLELGDFNQPLLKRLMTSAPGSYHHSQVVASLAESAAEIVDANPLLCRVGAYYHDVGKIAVPEYFIENQSAVAARRAELKLQMSSFVIISHVKEGMRLAREYNLDKVIVDIIEQHHGTSLVHYFYIKALEKGLTESEKSLYRYPGPRPRTKESAIIMLADAVEAASRTLKEPTYNRLLEMVHKIINNKFIDGQLDEVELTLADLLKIAERFANRLAGIYHSRIEYPEHPAEKPTIWR